MKIYSKDFTGLIFNEEEVKLLLFSGGKKISDGVSGYLIKTLMYLA